MRSEKAEDAIAYQLRGLRFEMHVPVLRAADALFQIACTRGSMKVGMTWQDECGELQGHELFGFCSRDGIAIEKRVT
jgi:hypothetical protein